MRMIRKVLQEWVHQTKVNPIKEKPIKFTTLSFPQDYKCFNERGNIIWDFLESSHNTVHAFYKVIYVVESNQNYKPYSTQLS